MRRLALLLVLACSGVGPAAAGEILYVAAASANRIDGYCVHENGGLEPQPKIQMPTVDDPRRLVVQGDVLYVAGKNRVESFHINPGGGLESTGKTRKIDNANPLDIAVDAARTHVYVPHRGTGRVQAFPLDSATGAITGEDSTSCIQAASTVGLQDVEVAPGAGGELLYVTESTSLFAVGKKGRIDVFPLGPDGELPDAADDPRCDSRITTTTTTSTSSTTVTTTATTSTTTSTLDENLTPPLSSRTKLRGPGPLALDPPQLFVFDVIARRIIQFELNDAGLFDSEDQQRVGASNESGVTYDLQFARGTEGGTVLAPSFNQGRVRAYALKGDGATKIARSPQRSTRQRVETTPVRILVEQVGSNVVLYVPGGEANRIEAYRLMQKKNRLLPESRAFSKTDERAGAFPNDVAIARDVDCLKSP